MRRLLLMVLSIALGLPVAAAPVTRAVRSTGQAAVVEGDVAAAARAARSAALREAVESGVGVLISSATRASNYAVIEDEIFAATRGYVQSYEVVSQGPTEGGSTYEVVLDAQVDLHQLEERLAAIDLAHAMVGRPRFLCRGVIATPDGKLTWSADLTRQLQEAVATLGERLEPAMAASDAKSMDDAELASTYLAAVLVDGTARVSSYDPVVPGSSRRLNDLGIESRLVSLTIDLRWLDESSAMNRWSATGRGAASESGEAERKALGEAVDQIAAALRAALVEDLRQRAFSDHTIHLAIEGTAAQLDAVEQVWTRSALTGTPLRPHGRDNGQGRYSVEISGSAYELARELSARGLGADSGVAMEILQASANRLRLRVRSQVTAGQQ